MADQRYALQDDENGRWSVIDIASGSFAIVHGRTLARLTKAEAQDAATLLNIVADIRMHKPERMRSSRSAVQPFLLPIRER